eukprot:5295228-Lingulodinium_polyedra.AAC.1
MGCTAPPPHAPPFPAFWPPAAPHAPPQQVGPGAGSSSSPAHGSAMSLPTKPPPPLFRQATAGGPAPPPPTVEPCQGP